MADLRKQIDMSEPIDTAAPGEPARACIRCEIVKPASAFHRAGPGRRRKVCAACRPSTRVRSLEKRNSLEESPALKRARRLWTDYAMTLDQYDEMLSAQGGKCALCGEPPAEGIWLHVDHCHDSGVVRALLCGVCNRRLGLYEALHERAVRYLTTYGNGNPVLDSTTV
jgi:Autographiviridae endonuclease VII